MEEPLHEEGEDILGLSVASENGEIIFESEVYEASMRFNAITLNWKEEGISWEEGRRISLKTSLNRKDWTGWMEIESLGPLRDDEPRSERVFPEVPILIDGRFFQYRVVIRQDQGNPSPHLSDVWATYIDSRTPLRLKVIGMIKELIPIAKAANDGPTIISRGGWGSPDPYGIKFKGTIQYWEPSYSPVKQIFVHHTVFRNESDPGASVRAIWEYHTYTRGWGDIGYNYLIDQQGRIYEGRFGGDNVTAGHVYTYNTGSLGVAVLGCFQNNSSSCTGAPPPSSTMINSLTNMLAWKATNYEINPTATHTFCGTSSCLTLKTIAGHRDASATACPGNLIYDQMSALRSTTASKKGNWGYSAKQLGFGGVRIEEFNTDQSITLSFKNTGNESWSNTGDNRLLLKVANPSTRTSALQGSGWIGNQTPAAISEESVAPGEIGTFTFNLKTGLPTNRRNSSENFRLVLENGDTASQMFGLTVRQPVDTLADLATFYDYGNCETRIHTFLSTGGSLDFQGAGGWWSSDNYCADRIVHSATGDFNGDGISDIAVLNEPNLGETKIHTWLSNGNNFSFQGEAGWWQSSNYDARRAKYLLAGDFNNDGKDDLALFYEIGGNQTRIDAFLSNGSSFQKQGSDGWWRHNNYHLSQTTGASVGDFNNDQRSDLALFYDYGNSVTRIHVWLSTGSNFKPEGPTGRWQDGWWQGKRYELANTTSIPAGYYNLGGYSDVALLYDYGNGVNKIHVWLSTGSNFKPEGPTGRWQDGWWQGQSYDFRKVLHIVSGPHSPVYENRREDLLTVYDGLENETRIHAFLSTGARFSYQGSSGWWGSTNYDTSKIVEAVAGNFGSR